MIRLIATDIDGTLQTSDHATSPRTLAALRAVADAGVVVVPASGRQPFSILDALAGTFLAECPILGANGAIATHLGTGEVYFEDLLSVEAQTTLYRRLHRRFPGIRCVSIRDGGVTFVPQRGYVGLMDPGDHGRRPGMREFALAEVIGTPSLKFVLRDPEVPVDTLLTAARKVAVPGCSVTTSSAPFIEVSAEGVNKGSALARLCGILGIERGDVLAFGDDRNDIEMLAWSGHGVAMGHARPEVLEVCDERAASNDDDGLAQVIERMMAEGLLPGHLEDSPS